MHSPFDPPTGAPVSQPTPGGRRRTRRNSVLGVSAGLLGGGAIGLLMTVPSLTSAASDSGTDSSADPAAQVQDVGEEPLGAPAGEDAVAPEDRSTRLREALQGLVDDGTLTAEQADAVAGHLAEQMPVGEGRGPGRHGRRGPGFDGEVVAGLIGIDVETLRSELQSGSTIAEIATANGVDPQTVIDALVDEAAGHLDLAVSDGRLTQEEADAKLAELTERITDHVNNGRPRS